MFWNTQSSKTLKDFCKSVYMIPPLPHTCSSLLDMALELLALHLFSISWFFQLQWLTANTLNLIGRITGITATIWYASPELAAHNQMLSTLISWRVKTVITLLCLSTLCSHICVYFPLYLQCCPTWEEI